jgi:hypothetical protein
MKIDWHGFLDEIVQPERSEQESCAWLFSEKPLSPLDVVHVVEVKNIGLKSQGNDTTSTFAPDMKEFAKVKQQAKKAGYTRIGNVHTHLVYMQRYGSKALKWQFAAQPDNKALELQRGPSDTDLKYARRFNDIIRGIIVVVFSEEGKPGVIDSVVWHDQYGQKLELDVEVVESE